MKAALAANKTMLINLLEYHVIKGTRYTAGLVNGQLIAAMQGSKITVNIENGKFAFVYDVSLAKGCFRTIEILKFTQHLVPCCPNKTKNLMFCIIVL